MNGLGCPECGGTCGQKSLGELNREDVQYFINKYAVKAVLIAAGVYFASEISKAIVRGVIDKKVNK